MKILIGILVLFFIVFASGFFVYTVFAADTNYFSLLKESGDVYYKDGEQYSKLTSDSIRLKNHTYVKTEDGMGHVVLPNQSMISLAPHTEIQINFSPGQILILQTIGSTWHRVENLGGKTGYEVETPTTIATVRGTKFAVQVDKTNGVTSKVMVIEHQVEVQQLKNDNGHMVSMSDEMVREGDESIIPEATPGAQMAIHPIPDSMKQNEWFERNIMIDQKFNQEMKSPHNDLKPAVISPAAQQFIQQIKSDKTIQEFKNVAPAPIIVSPTSAPHTPPTTNLNPGQLKKLQNAVQNTVASPTTSPASPPLKPNNKKANNTTSSITTNIVSAANQIAPTSTVPTNTPVPPPSSLAVGANNVIPPGQLKKLIPQDTPIPPTPIPPTSAPAPTSVPPTNTPEPAAPVLPAQAAAAANKALNKVK